MADTINNTNINKTDDDLNTTTANAAHGTEPATGHDVTEGGVLGAVGGAVVGMLAGGPIGAVIGAVAGGLASAGAVGVVDKHDHDYDRTVGTDGAHNSITGLPTDGSGKMAHNTGVITAAPTSAYSDTTNTGVIGTTTGNAEVLGTAPASYNSNLAQNTDTVVNGETVIPIVEEELVVGKREVQSGGAHIRTGVIETPVEETVRLHEEHITVDRQRVNQPVSDVATAFQEKSFEVTETAEVPVVAKSARVVEEVVVGKTATDRVETVRDTVRRTDVEVDELTTGDIKKA